jgi:proline iminopeptidase
MKSQFLLIFCLPLLIQCVSHNPVDESKSTSCDYLKYADSADQYTGGVSMIPINTPIGKFNVWTKRVGNNPTKKVLLLHGGPGLTHELYECFDGYLPQEGIEYIYYDQLGSYYSDQPTDSTLWTTDRFVEEVEQVRIALGLDQSNFYLLGQSWGGILAIEYALKYQQHLKGLIISNMVSSIPEYNRYAKEVLGPQMPPEVLREVMEIEKNGNFDNPRYAELLFEHHYTAHILRKPLDEWPESVNRCFKHLNPIVYVYMQGYSEFGITGDATLLDWDRSGDLVNIKTPTLVIGATHDSMDPKHKEWMTKQFPNGQFLLCENGSHLSQYDDQKTYFNGLIKFINETDQIK